MASKLNWDDLLIQDLAAAESVRCLALWAHLLRGRVAPVFMSKFGDWFLRQPDGSTAELSVIEGTFDVLARTPEEFNELVNTPSWQETHLLSRHVYALRERNLIAGAGQCYGFAPHPCFTGKIDLNTALVLDIPVWQSICAQTFGTKTARV